MINYKKVSNILLLKIYLNIKGKDQILILLAYHILALMQLTKNENLKLNQNLILN